MAELPHPTALSRPESEFESRFSLFQSKILPDPLWNFKVQLPQRTVSVPGEHLTPSWEAPDQIVWDFMSPDPHFTFQLHGSLVTFEVDPSDWLEESGPLQGHAIVSRRPVILPSGVSGDVLASIEGPPPKIRRFLVSKWGPRYYTLALAADADQYNARLADDFLYVFRTFEPLDKGMNILSEPLAPASGSTPVAWKSSVPDSWELRPKPDGSGFEATMKAAEPDGTAELSVSLLRKPDVNDQRFLFDLDMQAARERGIGVERMAYFEEPASPPYDKSWFRVTPAKIKGRAVEMRSRVQRAGPLWALGSVVGPIAKKNTPTVLAWMRAKRALDLAMANLSLTL